MFAHITRLLVSMSCLLLVAPIASAENDGCEGWLPDFNCERDARYEGFTPPVSMPYFFEDPFITTEVSAHAIWHDFPWDSVFRGGDAYVLAVQARVAITEKLAFIATKDGYTFLRPGSHSAVDADQGFFDIMAGLKYALIENREDGYILTPALRFMLPTGERGVFSGNDSGAFVPSISGAMRLGPAHLIGSFGSQLPFSNNKGSQSIFYNLHADVPIPDLPIVPFLELNGTTWTQSGKGERKVQTKDRFGLGTQPLTPAQDVVFDSLGHTAQRRFEGADVVNLGSEGVAGRTIMTLAAGMSFPLTDHVTLASYYEFPITNREDIWEQRVDVNLNYTF